MVFRVGTESNDITSIPDRVSANVEARSEQNNSDACEGDLLSASSC